MNEEEKTGVDKATNAVIDGKVYRVNAWDATKAIKFLQKLLQASAEDSIPFIQGDYDFSSILRFTKNVDDDVLMILIQEAVCSSFRDGTRLDSTTFNRDFKDIMHVYKVFAWVCEVQYKDFFAQGLRMNEEK